MTGIAVIQNGTDVARSSWADTAECYRVCARMASEGTDALSVRFFSDEAVGPLMADLDPGEVSCLVLASNALTSEQVQRNLTRYLPQLQAYLDAGGGLVVLHQWLDTLAPFVPEPLAAPMATRASPAPDPAGVHPYRRDDVLLHYPVPVDVTRLRDGGHDDGPDWFYFKAFDVNTLPSELKAVLVGADGEAVLVRTDDHISTRVVLCTPLLDWQGNHELLANILRWAALGAPRRLLRRSGESASTALLERWLSLDGLTASSVPAKEDGELSLAERWLLTDPQSQLEVFITPPGDVDALRDNPAVHAFLRRGGTMLTTDAASSLPASRITAYVGDYAQRALAASLYAELRAVEGWKSVESAFDIRNIVAACALLWQDEPNRSPGAVDPAELSSLRDEIEVRLATPRHREDVTSSIGLAQTAVLLGGSGDPALVEWMFDRPLARSFEVRLQLLALRSGWSAQPAEGYLHEAAAALAAQSPLSSISALVRMLDSVALLDQLDLLPPDPADAQALAELVVEQLDAFSSTGVMSWSSVEATADVVRGLIALLERVPAENEDLTLRLAIYAVAGADVLQRALRRYERNVRGVAWRARLTHALVLVDRVFPIGLQRLATLRWPDGAMLQGPGTLTERALVEHLAAENKRLSRYSADLTATVADRDRQLGERSRAVAVGQAGATWTPTLILIAVGVTIAILVGSSSFWELLANLGVLLTALITVLSLLYAGLGRLNLLAPRAQALQSTLEGFAVPLLKSLGDVKGRPGR